LNKSKHRTKFQIIADMLFTAGKGSKKTHIMYGANLSYKLVCQYLKDLLECGLVRHASGEYSVTEKGREFIRKYQEYSESRKELREQINEINNKKLTLEKFISE